jgi:hypothetical protein
MKLAIALAALSAAVLAGCNDYRAPDASDFWRGQETRVKPGGTFVDPLNEPEFHQQLR